ncbi:MAG: hypothetical protein WCF90_06330 [Methanomicrobiales archaeon]
MGFVIPECDALVTNPWNRDCMPCRTIPARKNPFGFEIVDFPDIFRRIGTDGLADSGDVLFFPVHPVECHLVPLESA